MRCENNVIAGEPAHARVSPILHPADIAELDTKSGSINNTILFLYGLRTVALLIAPQDNVSL